MTQTIGKWLDLPASRFQVDEPLGSGLMEIVASNGTQAARENNLRMLWEHPGSANVFRDLPALGIDWFDWGTEIVDGRFAAYCGTHRVRRYGGGLEWPKLFLAFRGLAPSPFELGAILVAMPAPGEPSTRSLYAIGGTTSTGLTDVFVSLPLTSSGVGTQRVAPRAGTGVLTTLPEDGSVSSVSVYVGFWCTSGGAKAEVQRPTLFLSEP